MLSNPFAEEAICCNTSIIANHVLKTVGGLPSLKIRKCASPDWKAIVRVVSSLPSLKNLTICECNVGCIWQKLA